VLALPPLNEYVRVSPVLDAALMTTAAAVRAASYWISAYPTRSRYVPKLELYPGPPWGVVCQRRFSAEEVKAETLSDGQLSPPFQLPQPLGAVAGLSLGMDVGMIGGGMLADTDPVPGAAVVLLVTIVEEVVD
jgi:hypothetical protein